MVGHTCLIRKAVGVGKGDRLPGSLGAGLSRQHPPPAPASATPVPHQDLSWQISSCPSKPGLLGFFIVLQQPRFQAEFAISLFSFKIKKEKRKKYYISINKYKGCVQVIPCAIVENYF